ncbi:uncharacterized protein A4U43_C03F24050 [Asparagus officinalis]|uniref:Uncharacterized protein n=1 Tax=Asparagus officinalis TaxID=4686 RepID=A0A5P1FDH9_ASPOF|nr:uncharacterized protein A4U43_C03F24050 [Asparagus officinalis]
MEALLEIDSMEIIAICKVLVFMNLGLIPDGIIETLPPLNGNSKSSSNGEVGLELNAPSRLHLVGDGRHQDVSAVLAAGLVRGNFAWGEEVGRGDEAEEAPVGAAELGLSYLGAVVLGLDLSCSAGAAFSPHFLFLFL